VGLSFSFKNEGNVGNGILELNQDTTYDMRDRVNLTSELDVNKYAYAIVSKVNKEFLLCKISRLITAKCDYIQGIDMTLKPESIIFGKIKRYDEMKNNAKIDINKESLNSVTKSEIITIGKVVQLKFKNYMNIETSKIKNTMQ